MSILAIGAQLGDERYAIEQEIGRGGMQEVYLAHDSMLDRLVALKVPQDARAARRFRESAVMSGRVNHPNVAKTLDYFDESDTFYLVEEFVDGENLRDVSSKFDRLDPHTAVYVLHNLAKGVSASHRAGVVHRDLKPSNIMVFEGLAFHALKITDFGIAKMAQHEVNQAVSGGERTTRKSTTMMNQLAYAAPEVVDSPHTASKPADVWAIAAIAWELLTGTPPFGSGLKAIRIHASGTKPPLPTEVAAHPQFGRLGQMLHNIVMQCLEVDPDARPTAAELATQCDALCYLPPRRRELGVVNNYVGRTRGFLLSDAQETVFFHSQSVVGKIPSVGKRVWFSKFPGEPRSRALPVVPLRDEPKGDTP